MTRRRKIAVAIVLTLVGVAIQVGYGVIRAVRCLPEAYAAWDTGTLLVEYMESHDGTWPSSWDDLWSVMSSNAETQITLMGFGANDTNYVSTLRKMVAVDWTFDPARGGQRPPVTRLDGTRFRKVWQGAEPNDMVRSYWKNRTITNVAKPR